jgi:hypothetical protein
MSAMVPVRVCAGISSARLMVAGKMEASAPVLKSLRACSRSFEWGEGEEGDQGGYMQVVCRGGKHGGWGRESNIQVM